MGVRLRSWAVISGGGSSFPLVVSHFSLWAVSFVHEFVGVPGAPLLGWWMHEAVHGVVVRWLVVWSWGIMVTCWWWLVVICHCGSCDVAASHMKNEEVGGVMGLT